VSLDDGRTWRFADIQRFAPPNAAGKHWAWVHYSLSVPVGAHRGPSFDTYAQDPAAPHAQCICWMLDAGWHMPCCGLSACGSVTCLRLKTSNRALKTLSALQHRHLSCSTGPDKSCVSATAVDLMQAQELMCRCYDGSQNTQPNTFTWNLMGMMNNCVYRVKVGCLHPPGCCLF